MAEHKVSGIDVFLMFSRDGNTYDTLVCLTNSSVTRTTSEIDAKSQCGPDTQPGTQANAVSFEGQVMQDPSSGRISTDELDDFWRNKETVYWKLGKLTPAIGDVTYSGTGFIAELNENNPIDNVSTFTGKIGIYGILDKSTATS